MITTVFTTIYKMNFNFLGRVCRIAAIGAILLSSASCIRVNEELGENLIPTDQLWEVFPRDPQPLRNIKLHMSDSLSGYSATRMTLGSVKDDLLGTCVKGASITLVPVVDSIDFGQNTKVKGFHFTAVRDTLSMVYDNQERIIQNIYVSALKTPLDSTVLYAGAFMNEATSEKFLNLSDRITDGVPVYDGGDSLSFDFSKEYAERVIAGIKRFQTLEEPECDSLDFYLKEVPGIYITTDTPVGLGGRINMFELGIDYDSYYGYITGNYAELKITADYDDRKDVDTSFVFMFGPGDFLKNLESSSEIPQYSFNASNHYYDANSQLNMEELLKEGIVATDKIYIEGGSGVKPIISAKEIREIIENEIAQTPIEDISEVVINKATIILPYNVEGDYDKLDKFPTVLSPTLRLKSTDGSYVTYAGLTDASVSSENQGDINRSLSMFSPDISHHVQEIMKVKKDADYEKNIAKYDIWFLIMHEEVTETESSSSSAYDDYYQNLLYSSYYNNMMYDPYGYGYGYGGYGGYGYGGYGGYGNYGYSNYYNYLMMAQYASASSSSSTTSSVELDKDRYYRCYLNGPDSSDDIKQLPRLKVTFSAPKSAE